MERIRPADIAATYGMTVKAYIYFVSLGTRWDARKRRRERALAVKRGEARPFEVPYPLSKRQLERLEAVKVKVRRRPVPGRDARGENEARLLGGIAARGAKTRDGYVRTPDDREITQEERRARWQPPARDTSRFSGNSVSRQAGRGHSGVSDSDDRSFFVGESMDPAERWARKDKHKARRRKQKARKQAARAAAQAAAAEQARQQPGQKAQETSRPAAKRAAAAPTLGTGAIVGTAQRLDQRQAKALDNNWRIHGGDPEWKGWGKLIPGKTKEVLFAEARRLGLDQPDDGRWTKGEVAVFKMHRKELKPHDERWREHLPRKSPKAIAEAYGRKGVAPR